MKEIAYKRIAEIRIRLASLICEQLNGSYKNEFKGKMVSILARTGIGNVYNLIYDYATKNPDNCDSIIALSKYDRPESLEFFKEKLKDHRSLHRDLIVECLGNYNKPELVNYIKTFLADEDRQVRFQAIYALYNIGGREAALAMCDYISDPDEWISMTILRLLCRMKVLDTIPILTEKYHADTDLRRKALMISFLSRFKSITLLEAFDDALQARDARLRANAIEAIGDLKLPEEELTKRIVPFLNDPNNRIRANAILAMAKITPEKVKAQIIEMCNSDDVQLRRSAAFILCMIPPDQFFKEAEKLIVDENDTVRKRMIQSLKNFPHQFISANINKVLSDENKWIRKYAVDMVASIPAFEATPIVNILKSEQAAPNIEACLNFLVSHPSDNAMSSLKIHFKDQRLPVVKAMLKALLAIGGVEEVKKMAPRLEQRDPIVVQNITSTLLESGSLETLEEFLNRFQKIKTNNNMELVLPALESVVETICKGEKMPPKLLKALSDEPINQNAGFGTPRLQQFQPQQFARPQVPPFNQPMPPNMGVPPIPPQNQENFGIQQQAVPNLQNLRTNTSIPQINQNPQENLDITQQVVNQDQNQSNVDANNMSQQVEQIQNAEQNLDLNMDIPQQDDMGVQAGEDLALNMEMPQQADMGAQADEDLALSFDIPQQTEAEEQAGEDFSLKLDLPQIAEPMSNGGLDMNFDAQNSYSNPLLNQDQLIDQQPSDQGAVQPTDQTIPSGQLFQELPPLTKTEIPVENQNNSNLGFNGLGFGVDNGSDNSSMMLPSFQELDTLNMPNAPEVSIAKKPSIPHYKAGLKAYNLGKYPKAIEEFNKSIANNESAPKAIDMYLGIMLSEKNEYDDAIPHFKAFIKNTPDNSKAHFLLGKCYRKNKDWQNLINTYQLFIEGELETTPKMKKRIYQDMGTACAILGKSETAVRLLTALYKLETDNAEIGYYLALALYKMKKSSEAAVIIDKAAKTAPKGKPLEKQITALSQTIRAGVPVSE